MKALILAGGSGTRLWPLSRKNFPKQFLKLNSSRSLFQQTAERLLTVLSIDDLVIMTNNEYKFYAKADLEKANNIILEPAGRNTAPAIALGIKYCVEKLGCKDDEVIFVSPSDHIIKPADAFAGYLRLSEKIAKNGPIVTFGIKPTRPETGYGYIKTKDLKPETEGCLRADRFTEKPDASTAAGYISEGNYYWNSGMFAFSIKTMKEELQKHAPDIAKMFDMSFDESVASFDRFRDVSIDYAVMEKSDRVVTLPLDLYWNDIGSWDSLYEVLDKDNAGNVKVGDVAAIDTEGSLVIGDKRLIATIGLKDCLIVETADALLVAAKGETQRVKEVVAMLKEQGRKEALEHLTSYRPWGSYSVLETGPRYKIKKISVNPGEKLSLQKHHHRSEHWVVIKGAAKVTTGDKEMMVHENESVYVPKSTLHRLENPGKVPLEIIEVQNGEYVEEDDIVRFDDLYERT